MTEVPDRILEQFMVCAFRYALERRTGLLTEILEDIEPYWNALKPMFKEQIRGDIKRKIERDDIGKYDMEACKRILGL